MMELNEFVIPRSLDLSTIATICTDNELIQGKESTVSHLSNIWFFQDTLYKLKGIQLNECPCTIVARLYSVCF
ncbi:expressed unknown protein [Seminavis robusta]|uniref:Uncharacterized protein n=1 Tax=Seminavis robusta TaxID=568900 RepID=A0A9N8E675_9STRA|nr:expressed unknown protein [Seminavis robusta]|eukprot:Sro592_g172150.1 n/a (73) ;mRNA; r:35502-36213